MRRQTCRLALLGHTTKMNEFVVVIKQHPGLQQVTRRVKVKVPGKHFPALQAAEQATDYWGQAVEYKERHSFPRHAKAWGVAHSAVSRSALALSLQSLRVRCEFGLEWSACKQCVSRSARVVSVGCAPRCDWNSRFMEVAVRRDFMCVCVVCVCEYYTSILDTSEAGGGAGQCGTVYLSMTRCPAL